MKGRRWMMGAEEVLMVSSVQGGRWRYVYAR